jgi:hypothetical protein
MNEVPKFTLCIFLFHVRNIHLPYNHFGWGWILWCGNNFANGNDLKIVISSLYLGFALLHTTKDNDMTKKKKGFIFENFVIFRYI